MSNSPSSGPTSGPTIAERAESYRTGTVRPSEVVDQVLTAITERGDDGTWITVLDRGELMIRAKELEQQSDPASLPLFGIPFGVKDSIDVDGVPTTLACPDYTYRACATAPVVSRLIDAGAIFVGKTNLDQFATGLNGTRTPYPLPRSVFGGDLISGGSSSGSALAVATGEVPFTVATDTAGSGRVPPALNGIAGFKPSRGLISTVGLVPACRSLDCVSLIAAGVADLSTVFDVVAALDDRDPHTRQRRPDVRHPATFRVGLPDVAELEFFGDGPMREAHLSARALIERGFERIVHVPFGPFLAAGELLYQGPWVAERLAEFGDFLAEHADSVLPVVRTILQGGSRYSAVDVFAAEHRLGDLRAEVAALWRQMDVLVLPAIGTTFTVDQVLADPIGANTVLGHYTHFGNLLDLCAVVVPAGLTSDGRPAALMVLGPALADDVVLAMAAELCPSPSVAVVPPPGGSGRARQDSDSGATTLVFAGHHLSGQPRNPELSECGGKLIAHTLTAPGYRLLKVGAENPVPVLVAVPAGGAAVEVETWTVPSAALATILAASSLSVCLGRVVLADGATEIGFVADPGLLARGGVPTGPGTDGISDITEFGGWRNYLAAASP
ncbi:MAG TPA: allophanate hydrolase [Nakamurella sp.]